MLSQQSRINLNILPSSLNLFIELCLVKISGSYDRLTVALIVLKISCFTSDSDIFIEVVEILRGLTLLEIMLHCLISVLSGELGHVFLINEVSMDFLSDEILVLLFQVFNDLVHFGHSFDVRWVSKVILLLGNELYSHFVDLILFLEGSLVGGEVILDWGVELTPAQYLAHGWVQMSQILFLAIEVVVFIKLSTILIQNLVLNLSFSAIGSARVRWSHFLETSSSEHVLNLIGLFVSSS